jgi:hypothetical protein
MKNLLVLSLTFGMVCSTFIPVLAQDPATQPTAEDMEKQKAELEKNAYRLLDQVIDEAQSLRLPENRVRIQINAADLLWDHNQERARSLFALASDDVAEMMRNPQIAGNQRGANNLDRRTFQLRQELVLAAARHDAPLAYQLLAATRSLAPAQAVIDPRNTRAMQMFDDNLEQTLLGLIAALDPKIAGQNAEQMLEKGQFPRTIVEVLNQLQHQDPEAGAKLADKTIKRIQTVNILTNNEASNLAQALLVLGPRLPASQGNTTTADNKSQPQGRGPVLDQSAYTDLLSNVIDAALKATPQAQNVQRGGNNQRGRALGGGGLNAGPNAAQDNAPTEAQLEQSSARRLLAGLQTSLPAIDQYLPARASAVRQKMAELGFTGTSRESFAQALGTLQGNPTSDALVQAAAVAPPQMQSRIYQQAAFRALDEGNTDRARQIATDHLQASARDSVMQRIVFRELAKKGEGSRLDEIRQNLARLPSDSDRVTLLLQIATDLHQDNPKVARQLLEEARQMTNHRATNYANFEEQLKVAHAFAPVDVARSFEVLEPGISQLNELLSAAVVLNGFEVNMFRDGEISIQGGNGLTATINRYGQELALLAKIDFARSEALAGRFQFAESRIIVRLSIVQGALGVQPAQPDVNFFRNLGQNFTFRSN